MAFHVPNKYRIRKNHKFATDERFGNNGCFLIPFESFEFFTVASDGGGWEHVSVSLKNRCPNWREMCVIKNIFWDEEDCVVQYHPPKEEYVDNHPFCLHLWRPTDKEFPVPDSLLVGLKRGEIINGKI